MRCICGADRFSHYAEWPHASAISGSECQAFIEEGTSRSDIARILSRVRHPAGRALR